MARFSANPHAGGVGRSEHISLESDLSEVRAKPNPARPVARYELSKGGRGVTTHVNILPDQFISIETQRSGSSVDRHIVDLRFVEPTPIGVRKVPWRFLYVAIGLTLLTAAAVTIYVLWPSLAQGIGGPYTPVGLGVLAVLWYVLCYYRTTESLLFLSVHGRARVITIAGRLGTIRRTQVCVADLVTHIKLARSQVQQTRQAYLRDEMREHARLYDQGVFSDGHYNEAKRRILKAHE